MCHENHQLAYKCRQLKNTGKIHSKWFWNNVTNAKPAKIYHIIDIEKLLGVDNFSGAPNQKLTSVLSFYGTVRRLSSIYIKYLKR